MDSRKEQGHSHISPSRMQSPQSLMQGKSGLLLGKVFGVVTKATGAAHVDSLKCTTIKMTRPSSTGRKKLRLGILGVGMSSRKVQSVRSAETESL